MPLRIRVICVIVIAVLGVVGASVEITFVLRQANAANRDVSTKWHPAGEVADDLAAHMVDQETGERGFVITHDPQFLTPYSSGRTATAADLARLRQLVGDDAIVASDITDVQDRWQQWLSDVAQPEISAASAGNLTQAQQLVEKELDPRLFDALRAKVTTLQTDISALSNAERHAESEAFNRLDRAFLATLVAGGILLVFFLLFVQLSVLRPLFRLQHQLRRAAAGAFREGISDDGPPELREVARDVESLRTRLVDELERSENARQALEQRGPVVLGLSDQLSHFDMPAVDGLRIASLLHAAEGVVAGDLLDVIALDSRTVAFVIADVSGHGAMAGLEAITLKHVIGTALRLGRDPVEAMDVAAAQSRADERFATCAVVVIDVVTGELAYANAGHLPPLIVPAFAGSDVRVDPARLKTLEPTGPLLSVLARGWTLGTAVLRHGELLLFVTDGLVEARSASGEEFGVDGICKALSQATTRDVDTAVTALAAAAHAYAANYNRDDVTVLAVMLEPATGLSPASAGMQVRQRIDGQVPADRAG